LTSETSLFTILSFPLNNICYLHPGQSTYLLNWLLTKGQDVLQYPLETVMIIFFKGFWDGQEAPLTNALSWIWWVSQMLSWVDLKPCG
jgi:hypothetical protein